MTGVQTCALPIFAQIGCGYWGPNLLRNFSAQPGCHVKWVAEQSPQRRAFVEANYPKTRAVPDWETVMNDPDLTYEVQVREIYTLGQFLAAKKYRYLRLAYFAFIVGLFTSFAVLVATTRH